MEKAENLPAVQIRKSREDVLLRRYQKEPTICHADELYNSLRGLGTRILRKRYGRVDEDVVAKAITDVFLKHHTYKGKASVRNWFGKILLNHARMEFRKNGEKRKAEIALDLVPNLVGDSLDIETRLTIRQLVRELDPEARRLLTARSEKVSCRAYAKQHSLSERTVRDRWTKLQKRLKEALDYGQ